MAHYISDQIYIDNITYTELYRDCYIFQLACVATQYYGTCLKTEILQIAVLSTDSSQIIMRSYISFLVLKMYLICKSKEYLHQALQNKQNN